MVTGLYAFQATSTALYRRVTRGGGHHLSITLMESIAAVQAGKMVEFSLEGDKGLKLGAPVGTYQTKNGFININARRDTHWMAFSSLIGRSDWASDPRFKTAKARLENETLLAQTIATAVRERTTEEWCALLEAHDILHAPVNDYQDYFDDAQVNSIGALSWVNHSAMGRVPIAGIPGLPLVRDGESLAYSPDLGEHSQEILREMGKSANEIAALIDGKVVLSKQ